MPTRARVIFPIILWQMGDISPWASELCRRDGAACWSGLPLLALALSQLRITGFDPFFPGAIE
jgi:hypothetical protein